MNAIEISDLTKSYRDFTLGRLSLTLPAGCILGLVGENGAGKTTLFKLLLGLVPADEGKISLLGRENGAALPEVKEEIGVLLSDVGIPEAFTVKQVGKVMKGAYRNWEEETFRGLLARFSLPEGKPFREFSRGMRAKLGLAVALSHRPRLLLLDEPMAGLDPIAREEVIDLLTEFTREENHSVLISSHIVSDLERLCDYVAFLRHGSLLLFGEKDRLLEEYGLIQGSGKALDALPPEALCARKDGPYGSEALVKKEKLSPETVAGKVSLEELFVFMAREGKK